MADPTPRTEPSQRDLMIKARFDDGLTLEELGKEFGLTRERCRQILQQWWPGLVHGRLEAKWDAARKRRESKRSQNVRVRKCRLCGKEFGPSIGRYCSPAHRDLFNYFVQKDSPRWLLTQASSRVRLGTTTQARDFYVVDHYNQHGTVPPRPRLRVEHYYTPRFDKLVKAIGYAGATLLIRDIRDYFWPTDEPQPPDKSTADYIRDRFKED